LYSVARRRVRRLPYCGYDFLPKHRRAVHLIPVLGYADDALVVAIALRFATRRAGPDAIERHWLGNERGLEAGLRLAGLTP